MSVCSQASLKPALGKGAELLRSSRANWSLRGAEGSRRGSGTGTGLGLSLVAEHVKLHGGSVEVWSANSDGSGSIFTVTLPGVIR